MASTNQKEAEIKIRYDGDALLEKRMDAKQFNSSLRSFINLLEKSNELLNGPESRLKIDITADIEQNCFEIGVLISVINASLTSENVVNAEQLLEYLGIKFIAPMTSGLLGLIKKLRGRPTIKIEGDGNTVNFIDGDNNMVITKSPKETYQLLKNKPVNKGVSGTLSPLKKGCENISFYERENEEEYEETERFEKWEALGKKDSWPEIEDIISMVETMEVTVRIVKAWYEGTNKNKWKFYSLRTDKFEATMGDDIWLRKFQNNRQLAPPGSQLKIRLQVTYDMDIRTNEVISPIAYRVTEVINTFPPKVKPEDPEQLSLGTCGAPRGKTKPTQ